MLEMSENTTVGLGLEAIGRFLSIGKKKVENRGLFSKKFREYSAVSGKTHIHYYTNSHTIQTTVTQISYLNIPELSLKKFYVLLAFVEMLVKRKQILLITY